jgi:hypothetical protein
MQIQDLERIRSATEHNRDMRGLYAVSSGLGYLSLGLLRALSGTFRFLPIFLLFVGSIALGIFAGSYYHKTFGEGDQPKGRAALVSGALLLGAALGVLLVATSIVAVVGAVLSEIRFIYLGWGSLFLGVWIWRKCRLSLSHYLALGILLLALAAPGPSSGFLFPGLATQGVAEILGGIAMILSGLLDHWQLVRLLGTSATASQPEGSRATGILESRPNTFPDRL